MRRLLLLVLFLGLLPLVSWLRAASQDSEASPRWFRGNTHTHTLWSDGDAAPEVAVDWYASQGYQFLVLSEHNCLATTERWFPVSEDGSKRLTPAQLDGLVERFGQDQVEVRPKGEGREMRLRTLDELRARFERAGEFLLVQGEEITAHWTQEEPRRNFPVHINALNLGDYIPPRGGQSPADLMNKVLADVQAHQESSGRTVLAHVNHPNFQWGLTWQDLASMQHERYFEVYNGHQGVANDGDDEHPSTELMWDRANALRVSELGLAPLYGIASDDSHNYYGKPTAMCGRGWIVVRAESLEPEALMRAMDAGDFYASSGVSLREVVRGPKSLRVDIEAEEGLTYTTRFIGVERKGGEPTVLATSTGHSSEYTFSGDELFVRAQITSDRLHPNPFAKGDLEQAWVQPVVPR